MPSTLVHAFSSIAARPTFRIGIAGCVLGRHRYGAALRNLPWIGVGGLFDPDETAARAWARALSSRIPAFTDFASLIRVDPPLDAILIASPSHERGANILAAAQANIPVLSEVPLTRTLPDTDAALRAAADHALLMPALFRRVDPYFGRVTSEIAAGTVGEVRQIRCDWSFPVGGAATLDAGGAPNEGWVTLLQHIACQSADLARWWAGDARTVSADIDFPDQGLPAKMAGGRQPRHAAMANLIVAHDCGQSTHHLAQSRAQQPEERYVVTGDLGQLELIVSAGGRASSETVPSLSFTPLGGRATAIEVETSTLPAAEARVCAMLIKFATCVQDGAAAEFGGLEARKALEIVHAAFLSHREGVKVPLPLRRPVSRKQPGALPAAHSPTNRDY